MDNVTCHPLNSRVLIWPWNLLQKSNQVLVTKLGPSGVFILLLLCVCEMIMQYVKVSLKRCYVCKQGGKESCVKSKSTEKHCEIPAVLGNRKGNASSLFHFRGEAFWLLQMTWKAFPGIKLIWGLRKEWLRRFEPALDCTDNFFPSCLAYFLSCHPHHNV